MITGLPASWLIMLAGAATSQCLVYTLAYLAKQSMRRSLIRADGPDVSIDLLTVG